MSAAIERQLICQQCQQPTGETRTFTAPENPNGPVSEGRCDKCRGLDPEPVRGLHGEDHEEDTLACPHCGSWEWDLTERANVYYRSLDHVTGDTTIYFEAASDQESLDVIGVDCARCGQACPHDYSWT